MSSLTEKQRIEWESEIKRDFPTINPWILKVLLDTYFAENGKVVIDQIVKNHKRKKDRFKVEPIPPEIVSGEIRDWTEEDDRKMKEFEEKIGTRLLEVKQKSSNLELEQSCTLIQEEENIPPTMPNTSQ